MNSVPYVDSEAVAHAYRALTSFGADLNRTTARLLLGLWRYRDSLTEADVDAVVERFPFLAEPVQVVEYTRDTEEPTGPLPPRGSVGFAEITDEVER